MVTIVLIEADAPQGEYLETVINENPDFCCKSVIRSGRDAIFSIPSIRPDIVLINPELPDMDGVYCIAELKQFLPDTKFLVITNFEDENHIFKALKAGASGYILNTSKPYQICDSLQDVHEGGIPISSLITKHIIEHSLHTPIRENKKTFKISKKEEEILTLLEKGKSYQEIAGLCFISINTLKAHIYRIYNKLSADNRTEAINNFFRS